VTSNGPACIDFARGLSLARPALRWPAAQGALRAATPTFALPIAGAEYPGPL
jgi:hypothetical protein